MRILLVYNPTAGEDGPDLDALVGLLRAAGHDVDARSIKDDDWPDGLEPAIDLVAVAGGDGTVRKVFKRLAGGDLPATLLPVGSANNIARSLGYDEEDPEKLIRAWEDARRAWCDVGAVSEERFVESAGGGVFGELLVHAEEDDRDLGGESKIEFGLRVLRDIVHEAPALEWGVEADGVELSGAFLAVEVMNVRELGPNLPVAPEADPGDGMLELTLVREEHRRDLGTYLEGRLAEREAEPPALDVHRAREIVLQVPAASPLHLDDVLQRQETLAATTGRVAVRVDGGLPVLVPPAG